MLVREHRNPEWYALFAELVPRQYKCFFALLPTLLPYEEVVPKETSWEGTWIRALHVLYGFFEKYVQIGPIEELSGEYRVDRGDGFVEAGYCTLEIGRCMEAWTTVIEAKSKQN